VKDSALGARARHRTFTGDETYEESRSRRWLR
jgi:hypothetical protein